MGAARARELAQARAGRAHGRDRCQRCARGRRFLVFDEEGQRCWVDVSGARLVTGEVMVGSRELRVGDEVDVIGRKDRRVDPRGATHLRDAPELTMLRAGPSQPLLVVVAPAPTAPALAASSTI